MKKRCLNQLKNLQHLFNQVHQKNLIMKNIIHLKIKDFKLWMDMNNNKVQ